MRPAGRGPSLPAEMLDVAQQQRLRAAIDEYDAARRRVERDAIRAQDELRERLVAELLPVLDNLDRSIEAAAGDAAILDGVRLVRAQLEGVLRGYGLVRFDATGERFDPRLHEAMDVVEVIDSELDGVVLAQWQAGYRIGDRTLRPARVQVGRRAERRRVPIRVVATGTG